MIPFVTVQGQNENNVWIFGPELGLDFNGTSPSTIKSKIIATEGCASISDPTTGRLLFYSNGEKVWDSTHTMMPNGDGLMGPLDRSSTQGVVIAPVFGHSTKYFIFYVEEFNMYRSGYLRFSVVDMSLNGGKGDLLPGLKNLTVDTGFSEKMILAPACNGLWLITHRIDSPIFYAYKIDNPFFPSKRVVSNTGGRVSKGMYHIGEMKLSPDQKSIAMGNWISPVYGLSGEAPIELFDFDRITGKISNPILIDSSNLAYSIEFSPDNSRFYVALFDSFIYQYDLNLLPSTSAVLASKTRLPGDHFTSLRLAPDRKIYINRHNYFKELSRINLPNLPAASCSLEVNIPSLSFPDSKAVYFQFGNNSLQPIAGSDTLIQSRRAITLCRGDNYAYAGDIARSHYIWNDGSQSRTRIIDQPGIYWVSSALGCSRFIDTFDISLKDKTFSYSSTKGEYCFKEEFIAKAKEEASSYVWHNGSEEPTFTFTQSGQAWVSATNGNCHFNIDSFDIKLTNYTIKLQDSFLCKNDTLLLDASVDSVAQYLWHNADTTPIFRAYEPGEYWVNVRVGKCNLKRDIKIFKKSFAINFSPDTNICEGQSVRLEVLDKNLIYLWQDGSTQSYIDVHRKGTYSVQIKDGNCTVDAVGFVDVVKCQNCIHIPNAFTPNMDGLNDKFRVFSQCLIDQFSILIYNRWGEQVFFTENFTEAWDGNTKGLPQNSGVYYYLIKVKFRTPDSKEELYKGDISLIR